MALLALLSTAGAAQGLVAPTVATERGSGRATSPPPAAAGGEDGLAWLDRDGDGCEDLLQSWAAGTCSWQELRATAARYGPPADPQDDFFPEKTSLAPGPWQLGQLRLLWLGAADGEPQESAAAARAAGGRCRLLKQGRRCGGFAVLAVDEDGLARVMAGRRSGLLLLDREGRPALDVSRKLIGAELAWQGIWQLRGDWTATVAILDSGCDTAHDDLGDHSHDNRDGPPPAVGDALDWFSAEGGWPVFAGFRAVGWHDVTDDFPAAVGPWDYHNHGTALAGVVAGEGEVSPQLAGVAPSSRLTIVKFYDFDGIWHTWLGDFLAGVDWVLAHRQTYRIRVLLAAVNWEIDGGLSAACQELLSAGILPVVAAGNGGVDQSPGFPALCTDALTVGAVNDAAAVAASSGRGDGPVIKPEIMAPGGGLLPESGRIMTTDNEPNDSYSPRRGTSLAAAHVAAGAFQVLEALGKEGVAPPASAQEVCLLKGLLLATAAPVVVAEMDDGIGEIHLPATGQPDSVRGWGLLQVEAAAEAALLPLACGQSAVDSLGGADGRRVMARRLVLMAGESCRLVATPTSGLDVALELHTQQGLLAPVEAPAERSDSGGPGGSESLEITSTDGGLVIAVVKRQGGSGGVTLTAASPLADTPCSFARTLEGPPGGWPNSGHLAGMPGPTIVITSLADVDPYARFIHALDMAGEPRPGWPIFMFLPSSLQGPLTAPLVWDLDSSPGDEIVVGSSFGRAYFVTGAGAVSSQTLAGSSVGLTAPVGLISAGGERRVALAGSDGKLYLRNAAGAEVNTVELGSVCRAPAVGELDGMAGEEIVVLTVGGLVHVFDAEGLELPGWPVGPLAGSTQAPVLCDLSGNGRHEVAVLALQGGEAHLHVLTGSGAAGPGDGALLEAPEGGGWSALSRMSVAAGETGQPILVFIGLHAAADGTWGLACGRVGADGAASVTPVTGLAVAPRVPGGQLLSRWINLAAPLSWEHRFGAVEPEFLVDVGWQESISGVPDLRGACTAWFRLGSAGAPLLCRDPLRSGGPGAVTPGLVGGLIVSDDSGRFTRVAMLGRSLIAQVRGPTAHRALAWSASRADGRNSGAFPLAGSTPTAGPQQAPPVQARLLLHPNPAPGLVDVGWRGLSPAPLSLDIYDLRGRRVRRLAATGAGGGLRWDGCDAAGRPVAAGSYLFALRQGHRRLSGRVVLTR